MSWRWSTPDWRLTLSGFFSAHKLASMTQKSRITNHNHECWKKKKSTNPDLACQPKPELTRFEKHDLTSTITYELC